MRDQKLQFDFNTALSPVNGESGAFQKEIHDAMAQKIRAHIMSQVPGDGICGMYITRFGMSVEYIVGATTEEKVAVVVGDAIAWAAEQEGFFPLRGNKTPEVTLEERVARVRVLNGKVAVTATLESDLYALPVNRTIGTEIQETFAAELVQLDGARNYRVHDNWVQLVVEAKVVSADATKAHIEALLTKHANDAESKYLPFAKNQPVEIEWRVEEMTD